MKDNPLRAPFPYFGGKRRVSAMAWERFGNVPNYIEPFFGSGAVLLARPHPPRVETVNDADAFLSNFWRALQADPDAVAHHADWPVNECDLYARHTWLVNEGAGIVERLRTDAEFYDAKTAGWWVWGACQWIGSGWCARTSAVCAKRPHLGNAGKGINRGAVSAQIPHLGDAGQGIHRGGDSGLLAYLRALSERLRRVRVCCGDWTRILGPAVTVRQGITAVFLDPPYSERERAAVYATETPGVAVDVRAWCLQNGHDPLLRIALCGYAGEGHEQLEGAGWEVFAWKANGGYGNSGNGRGLDNAHRERIWFSPHTLRGGLFDEQDPYA